MPLTTTLLPPLGSADCRILFAQPVLRARGSPLDEPNLSFVSLLLTRTAMCVRRGVTTQLKAHNTLQVWRSQSSRHCSHESHLTPTQLSFYKVIHMQQASFLSGHTQPTLKAIVAGHVMAWELIVVAETSCLVKNQTNMSVNLHPKHTGANAPSVRSRLSRPRLLVCRHPLQASTDGLMWVVVHCSPGRSLVATHHPVKASDNKRHSFQTEPNRNLLRTIFAKVVVLHRKKNNRD